MKSTCRSLNVFDFKEEDQLSKIASARFTSEFKNSNSLDKYKFLENVAQGTNIQSTEIVDVPCLVVDAIENDQNCDNAVSCTPPDIGGEVCTTRGMSGLDADLQFNSASHEQNPQFIPNKLEPGSLFAQLEARASRPGAASPRNSQVNRAILKSPSSESLDVISDADESMKGSSPATSSDIADDGVLLDGPSSVHCFGGWEMEKFGYLTEVTRRQGVFDVFYAIVFICNEWGKRNMAVDIRPDYIVYHDTYCTEPELTFSNSCISIKGSTTYGNQGTFTPQFRIDDVIDIESHWLGRNGLVMVKVRVVSKGAAQAEKVHRTSGIEELEFAVVDCDWYEKQEAITSLDMRYKDLWNVVFDTDMGKDGEAQNGIYSPKSYFPNFSEPFEEVVYPKGDPDAVSISKRDVDLLKPDTFVNDTIIDFYIKYLKNKIQPEERHRFHFFNSFFFRKLADLDKDPSSAFEGRAAFQRVRKWTRKVNLFEKDYIFIPVNFNYHWSLIVICHPGEVAEFQDEDVENSLKVPCILHMDSIKGSHTGLKDLVQSYLWEEWKERQKETYEDISSRFLNLRFVPLELPQQQNSFDCGLFLLHYVECFLEDAPVNFSPFKITKFSNFLNIDWFPPEEASLKRVPIWRLIYELHENHSQEISPASCDDKHCTSNYPTSKNANEDVVEKHCTSNNLLSSRAGQGIEITLLPTSPPRSSQCASDSGLVLREFFKPGATAGSFLDGQYQTFDLTASFNEFKSAMTPIEEDVEAGDHLVYPPSTQTGYQQLAGVTSEACAFPYSNRDFGSETFRKPGISSQQAQNEDMDSSPETSISASGNSLEVDVNETSLDRGDPNAEERIDQPKSPSIENVACLTESFASAPTEMLDVADSGFPDRLIDSNGNVDPCPNSLPGLSLEDTVVQENGNPTCDLGLVRNDSESDVQQAAKGLVQENVNPACDVGLVGDDSESDVQQAAKRLRLTPLEEEQKLTRSLSKELHL